MRALLALALLAASGCLHDSLESCGDQLCPATAVCMENRCVPNELIAACDGLADGTACHSTQVDGTCDRGICVKAGCGNGILDAGEICDDGNTLAGDGCAADCLGFDLCPSLGQTPVFSTELHQQLAQACTDLAVAGDRMSAHCTLAGTPGLAVGPLSGPLALLSSLESYSGSLVPEGDEMWLRGSDAMPYSTRDVGNGVWSAPLPIAEPPGSGYFMGRPSQGPRRRFMGVLKSDFDVLAELAIDESGAVTEVARYSQAALGLTQWYAVPQMVGDGLHVFFAAQTSTGVQHFYGDRASLDEPFTFRQLDPVAPVVEAFMTDNCERLFFPGLSSVFYVRQIARR